MNHEGASYHECTRNNHVFLGGGLFENIFLNLQHGFFLEFIETKQANIVLYGRGADPVHVIVQCPAPIVI